MMKEKITSDENTVLRIGHELWISYGSMEVPHKVERCRESVKTNI